MTDPTSNISTAELDDSDDNVVTLQEVIQTEQALLADANAVLGASDDKNCTYSLGYLNRQALYACLTCIPEAKTDVSKAAGVCFACCLHCHEGHELIELYTKRNFRCDCGNLKFADFKCTLDDTKADYNTLNVYNQNFTGVYCTCNRPYPDEDDPVSDVMIQCIMCEDWYHTRHLGVEVPSDSYAEMTCESCIKEHPFLLHYDGLALNTINKESSNVEVDVVKDTEESSVNNDGNIPATNVESNMDTPSEAPEGQTSEEFLKIIDKTHENELLAIVDCRMPKVNSKNICAKFWPDCTWRQQLCTCVKCLQVYENEKVMYLIDSQDPVQIYEEKGKAKAIENAQIEEEQFLNSLDRVPLMETIAGYNDLKNELGEFLKKFAENKKVVREEDVKEFFEGMKARKRLKTNIPHYCR